MAVVKWLAECDLCGKHINSFREWFYNTKYERLCEDHYYGERW